MDASPGASLMGGCDICCATGAISPHSQLEELGRGEDELHGCSSPGSGYVWESQGALLRCCPSPDGTPSTIMAMSDGTLRQDRGHTGWHPWHDPRRARWHLWRDCGCARLHPLGMIAPPPGWIALPSGAWHVCHPGCRSG